MTTGLGKVFIVDDEVELMNALCDILSEQGYGTTGFSSGEEALKALEREEVDVLLSDIMMPGMDGITLLRAALEIDSEILGIMMTGHGTIQTAVEAMKSGAFDYVLKPFKLAELAPVLSRAMGVRRLRLENMQLRENVAIYELTKALSCSSDLSAILNKVAEAAVQQCEADESSLMLRAPDGADLYVAATGGKNGTAVLGERVKIGEGIAGWVALNREPVVISGKTDEPWLIPLKPRPETLSTISVPMLAGGKLVGVLNVNDTHRPRPFRLGKVKALSILAGIAATALDAAELFSRVKRAEEKYRTLVEQLPVITYVVSLEGGYCPLYVSPQIESVLDIKADQWIRDPQTWQAHIHPDDRQRVVEQIGRCLSCGDRFVSEYRIVTPGKRTVWLHDEAVPVACKPGQPPTLQGVMVDVTPQKHAEDALRTSEALSRLLIEESPLGIGITRRGRITYANPAIALIFGYDSAEAMVGTPLEDFLVPGQMDVIRRRQVDWLKDRPVSACIELRGVRRDGKVFDMEVWPKTVMYQGEPAALYFVMDATEAKSLQAQLLQAQKMEAIGTLAGGFAHDFNNILTVIIGFTELVLSGKTPEDPEYEDLEKVFNAAKKGADLVRRLLTFSRKAEVYLHPLHLNAEIEEMKKLLSKTIPKMIEIDLLLAPDLKKINADAVQIGQVLMNLSVNARDAMAESGKLLIETRNVTKDEEYCRMHLDCMPGDYVLLLVSDTGCGMDQETVNRIFEPFFTTKGPDQGTGLGLSTVYGIVRQHNGLIRCYSEPGHGTTFEILFPALEEPKALAEAIAGPAKPAGGTETILLVDDEEIIRDFGVRILRSVGYTVLMAGNGREALDIFREQGNTISLVILDLVLPVTGGKQCLGELLQMNPNVKAVISSGYTRAGEPRKLIESGAKDFVTKPFKSKELLRTIRKVLDTK